MTRHTHMIHLMILVIIKLLLDTKNVNTICIKINNTTNQNKCMGSHAKNKSLQKLSLKQSKSWIKRTVKKESQSLKILSKDSKRPFGKNNTYTYGPYISYYDLFSSNFLFKTTFNEIDDIE